MKCLSDESLSAHLDERLAGPEAAHLDACGACAGRLERLRAVERALRGLPLAKEEASPALRATLRGLGAQDSKRPWRARVAAGASAAVLLGAVLASVLVPDTASIAQSLADEAVASHLRAFAAGDGSGCHVESESPHALASWFYERLGFQVEVPDPATADLVGARRCTLFGEETAAVVYRTAEAPVTVFIPPPGSAAAAACEKSMGQCTEGRYGQTVCVLPDASGAPRVVVGALPADRLCSVVAGG